MHPLRDLRGRDGLGVEHLLDRRALGVVEQPRGRRQHAFSLPDRAPPQIPIRLVLAPSPQLLANLPEK